MINYEMIINILWIPAIFILLWLLFWVLKKLNLVYILWGPEEPSIDLEEITRFEVINHTGRIMVMNGTMHYDIQDNRNTLKVFLGDKKLTLVEDEQNV